MLNFFYHSPLYNYRRGNKQLAIAQLAFNAVCGLILCEAISRINPIEGVE